MFRKTTITITLAAAAFVAIGSSAPADAHAIDCWLEPTHCIVDLVTPDRDRGPVEEDTTLDPGTVAGVIDIDLGGLFFPEPAGPSLTPGGVSTDVPPGTVITPALPDDVIDAITEPTVELPPVELPPIEAPTTPDATEPAATTPEPERSEGTSDEAPAGEEAPAATEPQNVDQDTTVRETPDTSTTTSVAAQDETTDDQADESVEAILDTDAVTDATSSFDPMMAALLGMLGALALTLTVFAAFKAGRRRN